MGAILLERGPSATAVRKRSRSSGSASPGEPVEAKLLAFGIERGLAARCRRGMGLVCRYGPASPAANTRGCWLPWHFLVASPLVTI